MQCTHSAEGQRKERALRHSAQSHGEVLGALWEQGARWQGWKGGWGEGRK